MKASFSLTKYDLPTPEEFFGLFFGFFVAIFALIVYTIWSSRKLAVDLRDLPRFAVATGLKAIAVAALVPCLFIRDGTEDTNLEQLATYISMIIILVLWIGFDKRRITNLRLACLTGIGFFAVLTSISLVRPPFYVLVLSDPSNEFSAYLGPQVIEAFYGFVASLIILSTLITSLIVAMICGPLIRVKNEPRYSLDLGFTSFESWFLGEALSKKQLIFGAIVVVLAIGLAGAQNTGLFRSHHFWSTSNGLHSGYFSKALEHGRLALLISTFDLTAIKASFRTIISTLPFIGTGLFCVCILNRMKAVGIIPFATVGGTLGWLWSSGIESYYATPYINFNETATLLGMIFGTAFGASANLLAKRDSVTQLIQTDYQKHNF